MLFHKRTIIINLIFTLLTLLMPFVAAADTDAKRILEFRDIGELNSVLEKFSCETFNDDLKSRTGYDLSEYKTAMRNLFLQYRKDYNDFETCFVVKAGEHAKSYSDKWLKDLKMKFGEKYVAINVESISNLIVNISRKHDAGFCIESERKAIHSEIQYVTLVREFFKKNTKFYESLNESDRKPCLNHKKTADIILSAAIEYPIQRMLYGGRVAHALSLNHRVELKKDVFEFIINHPQFSFPFPMIKAVSDLRISEKK